MNQIESQPKFPILTFKKHQTTSNDPEKKRNRFGRMVYGHKTAGEICIMKKEEFENFKSYEPQRGWSSVKTRSKSSSGSSGSLAGI
jgi:hypothetical protein